MKNNIIVSQMGREYEVDTVMKCSATQKEIAYWKMMQMNCF